MFDPLENFFDDNIPDEVLNSDGWDSKLLPDLDNLNNIDYTYEDITKNFDYEG